MGRRHLKEPAKRRVLTFNIAWTSKAKLIRGTARHICLHVFVSASLSRRPLFQIGHGLVLVQALFSIFG